MIERKVQDHQKKIIYKGFFPNIKWSSIIKGAGIAAAIQASIALVDIWLPKITGTTLDDYWIDVKNWIQRQHCNAMAF